MRLSIILSCLSLLNFTAIAQDLHNAGVERTPVISFIQDIANLGEAMEGEVLEYTFKFINKGKEALLISNVLPSCGCTVIDWSRQPVYPSKKGEITVKFDTRNQIGHQVKSLIILSNSENQKDEIKLIANIIPRTSAKINH